MPLGMDLRLGVRFRGERMGGEEDGLGWDRRGGWDGVVHKKWHRPPTS